MLIASLPENEAERLQALHSYGVLDGPKEAAIDALVRVASQVCSAPIALVTLLDAERQWFLSCVGLAITETSREVAFCSHAILQPDQLLQVTDTLLDERFCDNPHVIGGPKVRFYAGAPLIDSDGFALGTLCVLDVVPRQLSQVQLRVLHELSQAVIKLLDARRTEHAHHATQRQNALLRFAEEMALLGHFRVDVCEGRSLWSAHVRQVLGWQEHVPLTFADFIAAQHPTDRPAMALAWERALHSGVGFDIESRVLSGESQLRYVHVKARCERDAATGRVCVVYGMLQDITERTQLRDRALHQSRLIATGTLAAGVGHEINNPLTYLAGNIELAIDRLERGALSPDRIADIVSMLKEANDGALRIRDIVRGLRAFARSEESLHPTDVRSALNTALSMARHELRHRATLHDEVQSVPAVLANEARLAQVFLNLLINAAQSFDDNDMSKNHVHVRAGSAASGHVVIEIEDNGSGIAKELQSRIYDPFFTTKPLGEGTGLGLSISHSLITSLKGEISCESEPGRGSKFRVRLPRAEPTPSQQPAGPRYAPVAFSLRTPGARRGRVLIVDDEPAIARSMHQVLGEQHRVASCTDPREACELLLREPQTFDVVFCDLMMPFMTGMDLYRQATRTHPELAQRFVFMTGASIDEQVKSFLAGVHNPPLEKPFGLDALSPVVQRLLRERIAQPSLAAAHEKKA